jgi:predicted amidophosphoribosyltransferase
MKYRDKPHIARYIAEAMADRAAGEPEIENADIIIPVPMHAAKKRRRGYNQTELIAAHLAKLLALPYASDVLVKTMATETLSTKNRDERLLALSDAFAIAPAPNAHPSAPAPDAHPQAPASNAHPSVPLRGKKILLIDDVFTTGSTADACTRTLLLAGAAAVNLFVFATGAMGLGS